MVADNEEYKLGSRILIVDDDPVIRRLTKRMLVSLGYGVLEAEDGVEALSRFTEEKDIELVLSDLMMPRMNGMELAEELRLLKRHMKFILISGYNETFKQVDKDMYFMQKPYTKESLGQVIHLALAS